MARYKQGESGNPSGRPKGAKDKKTLAWDELGDYIIKGGAQKYLTIIKGLPNKEFLSRFEAIMEYFKPKQQRTELTGELEIKGAKKIGFKESK